MMKIGDLSAEEKKVIHEAETCLIKLKSSRSKSSQMPTLRFKSKT